MVCLQLWHCVFSGDMSKVQLLLWFKEEKRKTCVTQLVQPSWNTFQQVPLGMHFLLRIEFLASMFLLRFRTRKTLEAWHTRVRTNANNNSCPLPGQYNNLLTNIHNYLHFYYFVIHAFYSNVLIAFLSVILPVKDCSSGSQKLVVLNCFSQRSYLNFKYVSSWLNKHSWTVLAD